MSETKAYVVLFACGLLAEVGTVIGLEALGASGEAQVSGVMICLVVMSFLVGVIGVHYEPDDGKQRSRSDH
jgi:hypothetical protein